MNNPRALRPEQQERPRHQFSELRPWHAYELPRRSGGVRQRPEKIERRSYTELSPRLSGMLHRRMKRLSKKEPDARLGQAALDDGRRRGHPDPERLEHIGAPREAGRRPVSMFRDPDAAGGEHKRGAGRNIERPG